MWFLRLLIQLFTSFGLLFIGIICIDSSWGLGLVILYWFCWIIINIAVILWGFYESDSSAEDIKNNIKLGWKIAKKCPYCMKNLPSYFTSKCPYCTADL